MSKELVGKYTNFVGLLFTISDSKPKFFDKLLNKNQPCGGCLESRDNGDYCALGLDVDSAKGEKHCGDQLLIDYNDSDFNGGGTFPGNEDF